MKAWKISAVTGTIVMAFGLATAPALADSGEIYSGGGSDCAGLWRSGPEEFSIMDRQGGDDNDYCYIEYGPAQKLTNGKRRRVTIPEDSSIGAWQTRTPDLSGIDKMIYFKVCEERENDPDLCSNVDGYER
ncbi:MAG: hypothetical protein ACRDRX_28035 [Pseudonocardiaceae bacterium]